MSTRPYLRPTAHQQRALDRQRRRSEHDHMLSLWRRVLLALAPIGVTAKDLRAPRRDHPTFDDTPSMKLAGHATIVSPEFNPREYLDAVVNLCRAQITNPDPDERP